jgi:hypothetical protein
LLLALRHGKQNLLEWNSMKKNILTLALLSMAASPAFADQTLVERFRIHNVCDRFDEVGCSENRTESYARKDRARGAAVSACNVGPGDITLKIRRKQIRRWETAAEQVVKPNHCYSIATGNNNLVRRQYEIKVNSPEGTSYHMARAFRETYHDAVFALFSYGPY